MSRTPTTERSTPRIVTHGKQYLPRYPVPCFLVTNFRWGVTWLPFVQSRRLGSDRKSWHVTSKSPTSWRVPHLGGVLFWAQHGFRLPFKPNRFVSLPLLGRWPGLVVFRRGNPHLPTRIRDPFKSKSKSTNPIHQLAGAIGRE